MADPLLERTHASLATTLATMTGRSGGIVDRTPARLRYAVRVADPVLWSGVVRLDHRHDGRTLVAEALAFAGELGHGITLWTRGQGDADLEAAAAEARFREAAAFPQMVVEAPSLVVWPGPPPGTQTGIVREDAGLARLLEVTEAAFAELDAHPAVWRVAYPDLDAITGDDVVGVLGATDDGIGAAGVGYLHGGVGELIHIGTHPEFRRKGLGTAVTIALAEELIRRGADLLSLQAAPLGEPVYRRLGFREIGEYRMWLSPAP
jgi:ribosomal protein S18 acetylase RimI-like enzyme